MKMKTQPIRTSGTQQRPALRGKLTTMSVYIKNTERSQVNDLMVHLKPLEKAKSKTIRRKEIIKIRAEINEIE
jgi:hypothetical protein